MSVRGYAKWSPGSDARFWVRKVREVTEEYRDYWPLSVRQVFYRLVAVHGYEKSEGAYSKLTGTISRARRAGYLEWASIRDGGQGRTLAANYFVDGDHFERSIRSAAKGLRLDRQRGQEAVIELWCEAGGMVPILRGIAEPYSARVNTGGGYDSVTAKHRLAERVRERAAGGLRTVILHVGDFDGSGEDMCNVLREDAGAMVATQVMQSVVLTSRADPSEEEARLWEDAPSWVWEDLADRENGVSGRFVDFVYGWLSVERVALTPEQVIERRPETAPPKKSDSRSAAFVERNYEVVEALGTTDITVQLEALTPPELEAVITGALEEHIDMDVYAAVLDDEQDVRAALLKRLDRD